MKHDLSWLPPHNHDIESIREFRKRVGYISEKEHEQEKDKNKYNETEKAPYQE